ncbi:GNAT family N-acetyltransferase [Lactobacillus sp. AN1001]
MSQRAYSFELVPLTSVVDFENLSSDFDCDNEKINRFLKNDCQAHECERSLATFLMIDKEANRLAGFYSTSIGYLTSMLKDNDDMPGEKQRNYLNLAYFAIDREYQRKGIGSALIKEVFKSTLVVAYYIGIEMIFLESVDESIGFYEKVGFQLVKGVSPEEYHRNGIPTWNMNFDMFIKIDDLYRKGYFPYENNFIINNIEVIK